MKIRKSQLKELIRQVMLDEGFIVSMGEIQQIQPLFGKEPSVEKTSKKKGVKKRTQ